MNWFKLFPKMLETRLMMPFLFLFIFIPIYANDLDKTCLTFRKEMDKVTDLDKGLSYCKQKLSEVSPTCRTYVYLEIAGLLFRKLDLDNTLVYYDKAIENARAINAQEALSYALSSKISLFIRRGEHKEIRKLLKEARKLIIAYPKSKSWIKYYEQNAYIAFATADYYKAIDYMDSTIIAANKSGYKTLIHETYDHLGHCYHRIGDYERSVENFLKSLELKEKYGYVKDIGGTYRNLAKTYFEWKYYEKAINYVKKSIAVTKENNHKLSLMANYNMLAQCYIALEQNIEAEIAIDSSSILAHKVDDKTNIISNYRDRGLLYFQNYKDYAKAETYYKKAYVTAKLLKDKEHLFNSIKDLIKVYFKKNQYIKVEKLIKELETLRDDIKTMKFRAYMSQIYSEYYEKTNQPKKALEKLKEYHQINDLILNAEVFKSVDNLEKQYNTKKNELTIANLNQETKKQEQIAARAKLRQNLFLSAAILLLFLLVIGFWVYKKLGRQREALAVSNQIKNRLFSIIAHDLRSMIVPFQRSGKILKYHIDKGNFERTIEISTELEKNSEGLSNMLDNLLNWSLEQMNGYKMNPESFLIGTELEGIAKNFRQQANFKNTVISVHYKEDFLIHFDKGAFHVIFRNLIGNALKYTENGYIQVACKKDFHAILFSVKDDGVGMSDDQLQHIFQLKEGQSTIGTKGEKGTGLGLNLVDRFVKMNNGTITVSSGKKIGTKFDISFPLAIFAS